MDKDYKIMWENLKEVINDFEKKASKFEGSTPMKASQYAYKNILTEIKIMENVANGLKGKSI